jgi:hypothetical protein
VTKDIILCKRCLGCNQLENKYFKGVKTCEYFRTCETNKIKLEYKQQGIKGVQDGYTRDRYK